MAVPSLRHRAGKLEIQEKERKAREEARQKAGNVKKEEITPEEHEARLKLLKELGLVK